MVCCPPAHQNRQWSGATLPILIYRTTLTKKQQSDKFFSPKSIFKEIKSLITFDLALQILSSYMAFSYNSACSEIRGENVPLMSPRWPPVNWGSVFNRCDLVSGHEAQWIIVPSTRQVRCQPESRRGGPRGRKYGGSILRNGVKSQPGKSDWTVGHGLYEDWGRVKVRAIHRCYKN